MRLPALLAIALAVAVAAPLVPARAAPPSVVTDLPAIHSLTAQVAGELAAPVILLDRGADAHSFQLRPSQARMLQEADLVIWSGPALAPWLARALAGIATDVPQLALLEAPETTLRATDRDNGHGHDREDDHEHDDDHAGADLHAWLDPDNARAWTQLIAERLAALDPENAASYRANAQDARGRIAALEAEISDILAPVGDAAIVVFHDAYGHFSGHFGVNVAASVALGDAATPGAARLARVRDVVERTGAICVFPEAQHDPAYVELVVEGSGARIGAPLDPSGTTLDYGPELYGDLLRGLAEGIAGCITGR
ncbi:zinc ABC transporter substrate-binding protein [Rhodobacteraceae bacterium WD3A24]|nr:zinc ABC transporter substrate-binding protein [Rhodobacteraceae bacterium WD3A24]